MSAPDLWRFTAHCWNCGAAGVVHVSELDGWSYLRAIKARRPFREFTAPDGFYVVGKGDGNNDGVACRTCGIAVKTP